VYVILNIYVVRVCGHLLFWWNSMKKQGHWKGFRSYEEFEARDKPKKNKVDLIKHLTNP